MGFDPNQPRDKDGQWTGGGMKRWSRMNSTEKARAQIGARFKGTQQSAGAMRGRSLHEKSNLRPANVVDKPFSPSHPDVKAVAIQTAKSLDKDFRAERDRANKEAMKAAIARSNVPITKYPSQKPKKR